MDRTCSCVFCVSTFVALKEFVFSFCLGFPACKNWLEQNVPGAEAELLEDRGITGNFLIKVEGLEVHCGFIKYVCVCV